MANLPGRAWLDVDGKHVWWEHVCASGKAERYMMPWPRWKAENGHVLPSIVCGVEGCGYHAIPLIEQPPDDFQERVLDNTDR